MPALRGVRTGKSELVTKVADVFGFLLVLLGCNLTDKVLLGESCIVDSRFAVALTDLGRKNHQWTYDSLVASQGSLFRS